MDKQLAADATAKIIKMIENSYPDLRAGLHEMDERSYNQLQQQIAGVIFNEVNAKRIEEGLRFEVRLCLKSGGCTDWMTVDKESYEYIVKQAHWQGRALG